MHERKHMNHVSRVNQRKALSKKQWANGRDLLARAGLSPEFLFTFDLDVELFVALEVCAELFGERAPDNTWFRDLFLFDGSHMVLTEEGWIPAKLNTQEATGCDPMEVLDEVNAP